MNEQIRIFRGVMMKTKLWSQILGNTQRLGAREDILTGILATLFQVSRSFTEEFYSLIMEHSGLNPEEFVMGFPENYGVNTVEKIAKKRYEWIEDKRIAFTSDILLFDRDAEEWAAEKPRPEPSFLFAIECKESGALTKGQLRGYPFLEVELFKRNSVRVFTLLLFHRASKEEQETFSYAVNWVDLYRYFEVALEGVTHEAEIADIRSLMNLYREQLSFDRAALLDVEAVRPDVAAEKVCEWVRSRLPCEGTIKPRSAEVKIGNRIFRGKWLCLKGDLKQQLWLYVERKNNEFIFQVERWSEQVMAGRALKLNAPTQDDLESFGELLADIMQEQLSFESEV